MSFIRQRQDPHNSRFSCLFIFSIAKKDETTKKYRRNDFFSPDSALDIDINAFHYDTYFC